jgi:hypothetical protein
MKTCGAYNITTTPISFSSFTQCEGQTLQVYKAFTECLPTITIQAFGGGGTPNCPYRLIIEQVDKTSKFDIEPRENFIATFDCVKEIIVRCENNPASFCNVNVQLYISGCLTCC